MYFKIHHAMVDGIAGMRLVEKSFLFQIPDNAPASFIQDLVTDIRNSKSSPIPPFNNYLNGLFWDG